MPFTREIQRLIYGFTAVFFIILLASAYWAVEGEQTLLEREDNPRLFEEEASIVRGRIVDRFEEPLVISSSTNGGRAARTYLEQSMNSVLGYYSLRYGQGGIESAYHEMLRGTEALDDFSEFFAQNWLHQPQYGADIRLTLDLAIQQQVVETIGDYTGAAVVLSVPDGEVLALVSLPTYDPNTLDQQWDTLVNDPSNPFFNRAVQGRYQPGSALQPILMTAALIHGVPVDELQPGASQPVELDDVTLRCAQRPPADRLVLSESLAFGCPAPFVNLYHEMGPAPFDEVYDLYGLDQRYTLPGFDQLLPLQGASTEEVTPPPIDDDPSITEGTTVPSSPTETVMTLENILGQGSITLSPLDLAVSTASIVNEGNAPMPFILSGIRQPGETTFTPVNNLAPTRPVTTAHTSRRLQEMMRSATTLGAATRAARTGMNVGGHVGIAYSGDNTYSWFNGYVITGVRQGIVVSLVLENVDNPSEVAAMGGQILETAFNRPIVSHTAVTP